MKLEGVKVLKVDEFRFQTFKARRNEEGERAGRVVWRGKCAGVFWVGKKTAREK